MFPAELYNNIHKYFLKKMIIQKNNNEIYINEYDKIYFNNDLFS